MAFNVLEFDSVSLPSLQNLSGGGTVLVVAEAADAEADKWAAAAAADEGPGVATLGGSVEPIGIVAKRRNFKPGRKYFIQWESE